MKAPGVKLMKQQKIKKVPQRKCVGCGEMKDKKSLLRIVRSPEGEISLDLTGKKIRARSLCLPQPGMHKKSC